MSTKSVDQDKQKSQKAEKQKIPSSSTSENNSQQTKSDHTAKRGSELTKEIQESKELGQTYRAGHQGKDTLKEKIKHEKPNGHAEINEEKIEQEFKRSQSN